MSEHPRWHSRRQALGVAAGAASLAVSRRAWAQAYPTRPVRIIVPAAAGGGADIAARLMGRWLTERLGHQFIIENRPGAGGNLGIEAVVRAQADGHTLLLFDGSPTTNATLYQRLNFNFIRDIMPVAGIMRFPLILVLNPSFPPKTVPEFIAYAKSNPGKVNMASPGNGSAQHQRVSQDNATGRTWMRACASLAGQWSALTHDRRRATDADVVIRSAQADRKR